MKWSVAEGERLNGGGSVCVCGEGGGGKGLNICPKIVLGGLTEGLGRGLNRGGLNR